MKTRHRAPHAEAVLSFLRSIGALITSVRRVRRIAIEWRFDGRHHVTTLPIASGSPNSTANRAIAAICRSAGIEVVA